MRLHLLTRRDCRLKFFTLRDISWVAVDQEALSNVHCTMYNGDDDDDDGDDDGDDGDGEDVRHLSGSPLSRSPVQW